MAQPASPMTSVPRIPPMGWIQSFVVFGSAALLLSFATRILIPVLSQSSGLESVVWWFLMGGLAVFVPLMMAGWVLLRRKHKTGYRLPWGSRLQFRRVGRADWWWGVRAVDGHS